MKILLSTWAITTTLGISMATATTRLVLETALEALDAFEDGFAAQIRGTR